jgi:hypothetical protein
MGALLKQMLQGSTGTRLWGGYPGIGFTVSTFLYDYRFSSPFYGSLNSTMKASRYLRVSLAKAHCDWCMGTSCVATTGRGTKKIEHSIASGMDVCNDWVQQPENVLEPNKDEKMVPYLKRHFIYIDFAKSMYHVGSGKARNLPSCVLEFIRDIITDEKGIYRGWPSQLYGNKSPVREVLMMESKCALRSVRTEMTNTITNLRVHYE